MRRWRYIWHCCNGFGVLALAAALLALAGCFPVNINEDITLHEDGSGELRADIWVAGPSVTSLAREAFADAARDAPPGFDAESQRDEDDGDLHLVLTTAFASLRDLETRMAEVGMGGALGQNLRYETGQTWLADTYAFSADLDFSQMEVELQNVAWQVTMPGKVIESNAFEVKGRNATFEFHGPSPQHLEVVARKIRLDTLVALGAAAAALLALALGLTIALRRRTSRRPAKSCPKCGAQAASGNFCEKCGARLR